MTNKLRKVTESSEHFTYDENGNLITEALNSNSIFDLSIQKHYRNLLIRAREENS